MTGWKRAGWGVAAIMLVLIVAFASMLRVTVHPAGRVLDHLAAAPTAAVQSKAPARPETPAYSAVAQSGDPVPLIIPVAGIRAANLSDTWGQSRGGGSREHHAIDIIAPLGTPVLAAASGWVEKIFESVNGGHTIYVRTADGATVHYYAHLDSYGVTEKQRVRQGQQIATVGNTGSAAGGATHLHFEIKTMAPGETWSKGTELNPYPLLAASGGGS